MPKKSKGLSLHPMKFKDAIKKVLQVKPLSKSGAKAKPRRVQRDDFDG